MQISVGDTIPSATFVRMGAEGPEQIALKDITTGKKVIIFGLPGAYTGVCSTAHVPSFIAAMDDLKAKGVDEVICVSVNDPFVMGAWSQDQNVDDRVMMVADGSAAFTKATGLGLDLTERGLGLRCQRFSMVVVDGVVQSLHIDPAGSFEDTSAEKMLGEL